MKDLLKYKGFIGSVKFAAEDEVFYGKIEGINDLITFEGQSVQELKSAFISMVDEHIKDCEVENKPVKKSYTGSFNIRLTPKIHQQATEKATMEGITLNQLIKKAIEKELDLSE
jgi:predicted HicB family RNase H-like nuclease